MMNSLEKFKKKKDFLICIDSDGCAMDTIYQMFWSVYDKSVEFRKMEKSYIKEME